jgi:predicted ATPase/class 3 adenylate cyclase
VTGPGGADRTPSSAAARPLPVGTVTFLRTDIEGSMRLMQTLGPAWDAVNAEHQAIIGRQVEAHDGVIVRTEGDALFATFPEAGAGVAAAVAAQRALAAHAWPPEGHVLVRMGLHTGEAHLAGDDYGGFDVNRAARIAAVGHGGQIILSGPTQELTADVLPTGCRTTELGRYVLRDVPRPERLFQVDVPGLPTDFPPLRAGRPTNGNLEARLTSFVGRERELGDLRDLVGRSRLVTLTGAGGIGKSSLALEVARSLQDDYPDGAWFVPLASLDSAGDVAGLIARTIGLFDGPTRSAVAALPSFLAERVMLLLLDNFEHVIGAVDVVTGLLRDAPTSRIIVTSRAPLHVTGEQEYPVGPLGRTDTSAATRLFVDRARAVRPDWDPGPDAPVIDEICHLLDGLPLGVELAAARVALLPLTVIRDRLVAHLPLPGSGPHDAPARQRTLEGAVAWSHDLLEPRSQLVLHRLSVFDGTFALEQATSVVGDDGHVLDDLATLVDQSLVERDPTRPELRFRLLQTIQAFAAAQLDAIGATHDTRRRHAEAFLALSVEAKRHEFTTEQGPWIDRLSADEANLRAALRWAIEADEADIALQLVANLWRFWQQDGHLAEGRHLADQVMRMPDAQGPTTSRMWALGAMGSIAYWQADMVTTRQMYEAQLELARALGDEAGVADATFNLGHVVYIDGRDMQASIAIGQEIIARFRDIGDERGIARAEWAFGNAWLDGGDAEAAREIFLRSLKRFEELGDAQYHHLAAASLAWAEFRLGHRVAAARWAIQGLRESYATHDIGTATISLHIGVLIAVLLGEPETAVRLTGAFDAACERYGVRPPAALERFLQVTDPFQMARDALSPEAYDLAYAAGRRMTVREAVETVTGLEPAVGADPGDVR